jgi:tetratricopeptide (TPR) repeat protein
MSASLAVPLLTDDDLVETSVEIWCTERLTDVDAPTFAPPAEKEHVRHLIAANLAREIGTVRSLVAGEPEAWNRVAATLRADFSVVEAATPEQLDEAVGFALDALLPQLLFRTALPNAGGEITTGGDARRFPSTRGYLFTSSISDWIRFTALRVLDEPDDLSLLDDATALVARLTHAITELPEKQRTGLLLGIWRASQPARVIDALDHLLTQEFARNFATPHEAFGPVWTVLAGARPKDDIEAAQLLTERLPQQVNGQAVAASRSVARRKLVVDDPLFGPLLDLLLPYRSNRAASVESSGDERLEHFLRTAVRRRSLRIFSMVSPAECAQFGHDLPEYLRLDRSQIDADESWARRSVESHLGRCIACAQVRQKLDNLREHGSRELREPPPRDRFAPVVEDALLRLARAELQRPQRDAGGSTKVLRVLAGQEEVSAAARALIDGDHVAHDGAASADQPSAASGAIVLDVAEHEANDLPRLVTGAALTGRIEVADGSATLYLFGFDDARNGWGPELAVSVSHSSRKALPASGTVRDGGLIAQLEPGLVPPGSFRLEVAFPSGAATSLRDRAQRYATERDESFGHGRLGRALLAARKELAIRQDLGDPAALALAELGLGRILRGRGDRVGARRAFAAGIDAARAALVPGGDAADPHVADALGVLSDLERSLGHYHRDVGEFVAADEHYREAFAFAERLPASPERQDRGRRDRRARATMGIALTAQARRDFDTALTAIRMVFDMFPDDNARGRSRALRIEGDILWLRGRGADRDDAWRVFERAQQLLEGQQGNRVELAELGCSIGKGWHARGHHERALGWLAAALTGFRAAGRRASEADVIGKLGSVYHSLGRLEEANDSFTLAITIANELGERQLAGVWHTCRARVALDLAAEQRGDARETILRNAIKDAVAAREHRRDQYGHGIAADVQGRALAELDAFADARMAYMQALDLRIASGDERGKGFTWANLGRLAEAEAQAGIDREVKLRQALEFYDLAVARFQEYNAPQDQLLTEARRGLTLAACGERAAAIAQLEDVVARAEEQRLKAPNDSRVSYFSTVADIFAATATLLALTADPTEAGDADRGRALAVAEQGRARGLLDRAGQRGGSGVPAAAAKAMVSTALHRQRGERTTIVEYVLGEERSAAFVIDGGERIAVVALPGRQAIEGRAFELWAGLGYGALYGLGRLRHAHWLFDKLVRPVYDLVGETDRLLVAADGLLHLVPWAVLLESSPDGEDDPEPNDLAFRLRGPTRADAQAEARRQAREQTLPKLDWATLPYAVRRRTIAMIPSIAATDCLAAVHSPASLNHDVAVGDFTPAVATQQQLAGLYRKPLLARMDGVRLSFVTEALNDAGVVYLAGAQRARDGEGIVLGDGQLLRPADLSGGKHSPTRAVILNADLTLVANLVRGEGVAGVPWRMLERGVSVVIGALGPVTGASAPEFGRYLVEALVPSGPRGPEEQLDGVDALRVAQLRMLAEPRWAHPAHWGGYCAVSSGRLAADAGT